MRVALQGQKMCKKLLPTPTTSKSKRDENSPCFYFCVRGCSRWATTYNMSVKKPPSSQPPMVSRIDAIQRSVQLRKAEISASVFKASKRLNSIEKRQEIDANAMVWDGRAIYRVIERRLKFISFIMVWYFEEDALGTSIY